MVLLTSSAISVAISSSVVCTFTFLLFLSGYVLQQQTVRSLQEALRRPPEQKPSVTLPKKFWQAEEDDVEDVEKTQQHIIEVVQASPEGIEQRMMDALQTQQSITNMQPGQVPEARGPQGDATAAATEGVQEISVSTILDGTTTQSPQPRLAYILALSTPSQICSALLFFKRQRAHGLSTPSLVLLYPNVWESQSGINTLYQSALDLMRDAQDSAGIVLHPVEISTVWSGVSIQSQLLGSLQRNWMRWGFDRSLYLRSPGLALSIKRLDAALQTSNLKSSWTALSNQPQDTPPVLLMSQARNSILVPRGTLRGLTIDAKSGGHEEHHSKEMEIEARLAVSKRAGYVVFDEAELEHRRAEKEWYGSVFERFENGLKEVCAGTPFVKRERADKFQMKRGRGM